MERVHRLDRDIFTVSDLYTPAECRQLIERGENTGFEAASVTTSTGQKMMPGVRNNDRAIFDDDAFARSVWERVRSFVPSSMDGFEVVGLNPRFRFYRYDPGQRFKRHQDGRVRTADGEVSRLTFLLYLNADYEGGQTIFRHYTYEGETGTKHEIEIVPETGLGLFFVHERHHEGAPLIAGRKYVLRSDVLYAGEPVRSQPLEATAE